MEYSVQKLEKSRGEIAVSVDKTEWKDFIQQAFAKNKHRFSIEGFRPGKVPFGVLAKRYGEEIFYEDAADIAIGKYYGEIVEKEKINVVARPDVDINVIDADGLKFVCTVAVYPEFELGAYTGLTVKKVARKVKKEDVQAEIDRERQANARFVDVTDRAVQEGDMIEFDYSGSIDGVKFDGGTAEKYSLTVGSKQFIPGFEDQLIGMKIGESKDINVKFPEQYTPALAGKDAVFAIKINGIQHKELPVLDDEFVKDIDDELNTVAEWKEKIKSELAPKKIEQAGYKLENEMIDAIVKNTEIDIPECMVDEELDYRVQELEHSMAQYGLKFEDYLKYTGTTVEEIKAEKRNEAYANIKSRLVMEAIVKKENIDVPAEELNAEFDKLDEKQKNPQYMSYIANKLLVDKLFAFLKANNNIE